MKAYLSIIDDGEKMMFKSEDLTLRFSVGKIGTKLTKILSYNNGFIEFETDTCIQLADLRELLGMLKIKRDLTKYQLEIGVN